MSDRPSATRATLGTPSVLDVVKSASADGGLMRSPRFVHIAADCTMKLIDSVAMIGGMRSALIRR